MELKKIHQSVVEASKDIAQYVFHTPLEYSLFLSAKTGAKVYLKLESQQKTSSFKVRGAFNKLLMSEKEDEKDAEFVTASTGNHGLACALALTTLKKKGTIYVTENVSEAKENALKLYGVEIRKFGTNCVETEREARREANEKGKIYISPYADMQVVFGQGTIGKELFEDLPDADAVFITVGGGGLISGIGSYFKVQKKDVEIIGCLPANSPVMLESVNAGRIVDMPSKDTLSDASAGGIEEGSPTLSLCMKVVDRWVTVSENEIASAMYCMLQQHHKVIEGSAGVALASFLKHSDEYAGKNVVILVCGANLSMEKLNYIINNH